MQKKNPSYYSKYSECANKLLPFNIRYDTHMNKM